MVQVFADWSMSAAQNREVSVRIYRVDSNMSSEGQEKARARLVEQTSLPGDADILIVTTDVFGEPITLHIDGFIDTDLASQMDDNGFLVVEPCSGPQTTEREGRAGSVEIETLYKKLGAKDRPPSSPIRFDMRSEDAVSVASTTIRMQRDFSIIGVPKRLRLQCFAGMQILLSL